MMPTPAPSTQRRRRCCRPVLLFAGAVRQDHGGQVQRAGDGVARGARPAAAHAYGGPRQAHHAARRAAAPMGAGGAKVGAHRRMVSARALCVGGFVCVWGGELLHPWVRAAPKWEPAGGWWAIGPQRCALWRGPGVWDVGGRE
eukprot:347530-Chlamydomonas_euryale.AAC.1